MIWIILGIFCILVSFYFEVKREDGAAGCLFVVGILCLFTILAFGVDGIGCYPYLSAMREGVLSLQSEINTVKQARYSDVNKGRLIGGSLDNIEQSKTLSAYITVYAEKKAKFNQDLKAAQTYKSMRVTFWFANAMFIANKIYEIEPIK